MFKEKDEFRHSFLVSEAVYATFRDAFADRNPLHVDEEYAKGRGYEGKVMHGNILGGFLSYFVGEALPVRNTVIILQEIKYRNAFYLNDTLHFSAIIEEAHDNLSVYVFRFTFSRDKKLVASGRLQIGLLQ